MDAFWFSFLLLLSRMRLLPTSTLIELLQRLDCFVGARDELLTLGRDSDTSAGFRGAVAVTRGIGVFGMGATGQSCIGNVDGTLAIRRTLLWHGLTSRVGQWLCLFELSFIGNGAGDGLRLHESEEVLL